MILAHLEIEDAVLGDFEEKRYRKVMSKSFVESGSGVRAGLHSLNDIVFQQRRKAWIPYASIRMGS